MKVLIIDPNRQTRKIHADLLESVGIDTFAVSNLGSAFHLLKKTRVNLILTDVFAELIEAVSIFARFTKSKVLLLTNVCEKRVILGSMHLGISGYIIKSQVTPEQFVRLIQKNAV